MSHDKNVVRAIVRTLPDSEITKAWREAGTRSSVPPEWAFDFAKRVARAARAAALEEAAKAVEQHNLSGREWVRGSLWDALAREGASRIRAIAEGNRTPIDGNQQEEN